MSLAAVKRIPRKPQSMGMAKGERRMPLRQVAAALSFALVLNLNAITTIFTSYSGIITYAVFIVFGLSTLWAVGKQKKPRPQISLFFCILLYLIWAVSSQLFRTASYETDIIKFVTCLLVAYMAGMLKNRIIITAIDFSILLSAMYSLYVTARYEVIYRTLIGMDRIK